ncbi:hypothetical protein BDP27DRAFT_1447745 [Rhodocollybia butyracea]|uniref:Uncharacterized protein n=1 Tax=Rhodocollybia butyracea TaxID=206335 RepID=A0A9P5PSP6_9AGAR|nr:hypothetical protein BDP27DRAFT_1447745 [Rhodocollybia butyracea]
MRSALFLFTLIVSSILAVSPIPVPAGSPDAQATVSTTSLNSDSQNLRVTFMGSYGESLGDDIETVFDTRPKANTMAHSAITVMFGDFGFLNRNIIYRGLYKPRRPKDRRWLYVRVKGTGYGFMARGSEFRQAGKGEAAKRAGWKWYLALSSGEPKPGPFVPILGAPNTQASQSHQTPEVMKAIEAMQLEWEQLVREFVAHFMIKNANPPKPGEEGPGKPSHRTKLQLSRVPPLAMTFVDNDGKPFERQEGQGEIDLRFTVHINQVLNRMGSITYRNQPSLFQLHWFFTLVGGDRCTTTPCFGLVRKPLESGDILIVQPKPKGSGSSSRFDTIGTYPPTKPGAQLEDMKKVLEEEFMPHEDFSHPK